MSKHLSIALLGLVGLVLILVIPAVWSVPTLHEHVPLDSPRSKELIAECRRCAKKSPIPLCCDDNFCRYGGSPGICEYEHWDYIKKCGMEYVECCTLNPDPRIKRQKCPGVVPKLPEPKTRCNHSSPIEDYEEDF